MNSSVIGPLLLAIGILVGSLAVGGVYSVTPVMTGNVDKGAAYIVNRFTGSAKFCVENGCRPLGVWFPGDLIPIPKK